MSNVWFQFGHAPCDFHLRSLSYIFFMSTIRNYFTILFSKSLLNCLCSQFHIERVVYTGQHDKKSWDLILVLYILSDF